MISSVHLSQGGICLFHQDQCPRVIGISISVPWVISVPGWRIHRWHQLSLTILFLVASSWWHHHSQNPAIQDRGNHIGLRFLNAYFQVGGIDRNS